MVQHAQPLLRTVRIFVYPLRDRRERVHLAGSTESAHRLLEGVHPILHAAGRAADHAAAVERNVSLDRVLRLGQLRVHEQAHVPTNREGRQVFRGGELLVLPARSSSLW
jgi:hypothetical protein